MVTGKLEGIVQAKLDTLKSIFPVAKQLNVGVDAFVQTARVLSLSPPLVP